MLNWIHKALRYLFFSIIVNFFILIVMGINVRHRERLPQKGPAILVANHNSHLDAIVLTHLLSLKLLSSIHPIAAADYFLRHKILAWFAKNIIGIIPISRQKERQHQDPLLPCYEPLNQGAVLIFFPEGTRGAPEQRSTLKKGIAFLAERFPTVPIVPVFIHGLGKALPKDEALFVPFFCDVFVGEAICAAHFQDRDKLMEALNQSFEKLALEGNFIEKTYE